MPLVFCTIYSDFYVYLTCFHSFDWNFSVRRWIAYTFSPVPGPNWTFWKKTKSPRRNRFVDCRWQNLLLLRCFFLFLIILIFVYIILFFFSPLLPFLSSFSSCPLPPSPTTTTAIKIKQQQQPSVLLHAF